MLDPTAEYGADIQNSNMRKSKSFPLTRRTLANESELLRSGLRGWR